jgi:uncharacterized protein (DUF1330 family)
MSDQKQINDYAREVKKFMKQHRLNFIRNNERVRNKLGLNRKQLSYTLQYLNKTGFLQPWNHKIYQKANNQN